MIDCFRNTNSVAWNHKVLTNWGKVVQPNFMSGTIVAIILSMLAAFPASSTTRDDVAQAQRMLNRLGYSSGVIDGLWGQKTNEALEQFYKSNDLEFDGSLNASELAYLEKIFDAEGLRLVPLSGVEIENYEDNLLYGPPSPGNTADRYMWMHSWASHDWNNDGIRDFLYTGAMIPNNIDYSGSIAKCAGKVCTGEMPGPTLFLGSKDGTFLQMSKLFVDRRTISGQSLSRQNLVADFNGDGIFDLFIADHGLGNTNGFRDSYFLSQNDGTWLESSSTHLSNPDYEIFDHGGAVGDIDNDGDMDIVLTELKNKLTCWINDSTGYLNKRLCGDIHAFGIELGDMDGDGDLDLVHGGHESESSSATGIAFNDGYGNFRRKVQLQQITDWGGIPEVSVWDLDNDGDLDITISRVGYLYVGTGVQILENLGDNRFDSQFFALVTAPKSFKPTWEGNEWNNFVGNFLFSDVDKDGDTDVILVGGGMGIRSHIVRGSILLNNGAMSFRHIPNGESENPVTLLTESVFTPEHLENFNSYFGELELKFEGANEFAKFENPIVLTRSGASAIGFRGIQIGLAGGFAWVKYRLHLELGGFDFSIGVCAMNNEAFTAPSTRLSFQQPYDWGEALGVAKFGTHTCGGDEGYLGVWEIDPTSNEFYSTGIKPLLADFRDGVGLLKRVLSTLPFEKRATILNALAIPPDT